MTVETVKTPLYQQAQGMTKTIEEFVAAENQAALEGLLHDLTMSPAFHDAIAELAAEKAVLEQLKNEYDAAKELTKRKSANEEQHEAARVATDATREQHEKVQVLEAQLDKYRRHAAHAAQEIAALQTAKEKANGTFLEFTESIIGDLISKGNFEDGSEDWIMQRSTGIGGSDVGPIMKVGEKKYQYDNYREIIESKINPTYKIVESDALLTATGRGHAWEEYLRQYFAKCYPHLNVWYTKDSYEHKDYSWKKANFDGLISTTKNPADIHALLEIKTSSRPEDWGDEDEGYEGIPKNYFYQMLWYMVHAGLSEGYLIALINDHEIRVYHFTIHDPGIAEHINRMLTQTEIFWKEEIENYIDPANRPKRAFSWHTPAGKKRSLDTLAALGHMTPETLQKQGILNMNNSYDFIDNVVNILPKTNTKPFIVVDIETSSASPAYGRILEVAVVRLDSWDSTPKTVFDARFGLPEDVLQYVGVDMTDIHGITPDMVRGEPLFESPEIQAQLMEIFTEGTLVAHNKQFEERFFTAFLDGFGPALRSGEIIVLDTMDLMKLAMPETPHNRLEGFAEYNGIPYVDAHRAETDTRMTAEALARFLKTVHETGTWTPVLPSEADREAAVFAAQNSR